MVGFPYIFTFYSYKGGVGRSMALLNVAYTLAGRGRHVLIVDMDLEAPGVSAFMQRQKEFVETTKRPFDVLNLLSDAMPLAQDDLAVETAAAKLPPLSNYLRGVDPKRLKRLAPRLGELGRLDVIAADLDRNYWERHAEIQLGHLSKEELIRLSQLLQRYFKQQRFPVCPPGLEQLMPPIETPYDYVLVDSRTGFTDVGGLCIGPLADRLVVVTALNDQNIEGTASFMKEAGILPKKTARKVEKWDDADPGSTDEAPLLGPKPTLVVASPVPAGELAYKKERLEELRRKLGIVPIRLSYHPQVALMESVFVREEPDEYLSIEYRNLADRMMAQVSDTPSQLLGQWGKGDDEINISKEKIEAAIRIAPHQSEVSIPLFNQLSAQFIPTTGEDFILANQLHKLFTKAEPTNISALSNWGNALLGQAQTREGEEADGLYAAAMEKYEQVLKIKPDYHQALSNWGSVFSKQAKLKEGAEVDRLYAAAMEKYGQALKIKPDYHEALYNWGTVLSAQADTKEGTEADRLYFAAMEKYEQALKIKPDRPVTLNNWGNALSRQAQNREGEEAERLYAAAMEKYGQALKIKPDYHDALYNWGTALSVQARNREGEEAERLYAAAMEKYGQALKIKPDKHEALNNWGNALLEQAKRREGAEAERLYLAAEKKLLQAEDIKPGAASYNLACIAALRKNVALSIEWLGKNILARNKLTQKGLNEDSDFNSIRQSLQFIEFYRSLPEK